MNKIRADLNIESEILLQIKAEGKHLSRSVSLMDPSEENYIETVGSVYYSGYKFYDAESALEWLKKWELLSDFSSNKQEKIIQEITKFIESKLVDTPGYDFPSGYKVAAECYRESQSEIKLMFIDDSDSPYIDAIVNKGTGRVAFKYLGMYCDLSQPFDEKVLKIEF